MQIGVAEFLEKVSKLKKTQEKVDAIRANDSINFFLSLFKLANLF